MPSPTTRKHHSRCRIGLTAIMWREKPVTCDSHTNTTNERSPALSPRHDQRTRTGLSPQINLMNESDQSFSYLLFINRFVTIAYKYKGFRSTITRIGWGGQFTSADLCTPRDPSRAKQTTTLIAEPVRAYFICFSLYQFQTNTASKNIYNLKISQV